MTGVPISANADRRGGRPRSPEAHAAILDATVELLREVGYARLTVEGVASRANVGKTTVYRWWPSKTALVFESLIASSSRRSVTLTGDPAEDARAVGHATVTSYRRTPVGPGILPFAVDALRDEPDVESVDALLQPYRDVVDSILDQAVQQHRLRADVDRDLVQDLIAGTLLYRLFLSRRPMDGVVEQVVDLLLDGTAPRRPGT